MDGHTTTTENEEVINKKKKGVVIRKGKSLTIRMCVQSLEQGAVVGGMAMVPMNKEVNVSGDGERKIPPLMVMERER
ncbi:hypothetical protein Tco_0929110 [Tanacetum coccineum]